MRSIKAKAKASKTFCPSRSAPVTSPVDPYLAMAERAEPKALSRACWPCEKER